MTATTPPPAPNEADALDSLDQALSHPMYARLLGPDLTNDQLLHAAATHKRLGVGTRAHLQQRIDFLHARVALESAADVAELRESVDEFGDLLDRGLQAVVSELRAQRELTRRTVDLLADLVRVWSDDSATVTPTDPAESGSEGADGE